MWILDLKSFLCLFCQQGFGHILYWDSPWNCLHVKHSFLFNVCTQSSVFPYRDFSNKNVWHLTAFVCLFSSLTGCHILLSRLLLIGCRSLGRGGTGSTCWTWISAAAPRCECQLDDRDMLSIKVGQFLPIFWVLSLWVLLTRSSCVSVYVPNSN